MSIQSLSPYTKRLNRTKQILPETISKREINLDKQYLSLEEWLYADINIMHLTYFSRMTII